MSLHARAINKEKLKQINTNPSTKGDITGGELQSQFRLSGTVILVLWSWEYISMSRKNVIQQPKAK
jgi:hypothetical protein